MEVNHQQKATTYPLSTPTIPAILLLSRFLVMVKMEERELTILSGETPCQHFDGNVNPALDAHSGNDDGGAWVGFESLLRTGARVRGSRHLVVPTID
jgi:hypothetical protein